MASQDGEPTARLEELRVLSRGRNRDPSSGPCSTRACRTRAACSFRYPLSFLLLRLFYIPSFPEASSGADRWMGGGGSRATFRIFLGLNLRPRCFMVVFISSELSFCSSSALCLACLSRFLLSVCHSQILSSAFAGGEWGECARCSDLGELSRFLNPTGCERSRGVRPPLHLLPSPSAVNFHFGGFYFNPNFSLFLATADFLFVPSFRIERRVSFCQVFWSLRVADDELPRNQLGVCPSFLSLLRFSF